MRDDNIALQEAAPMALKNVKVSPLPDLASKAFNHDLPPQFLSTAEAARMLGLSTTLVQTLVDQGELKGWKTRGGHRRILLASIAEYQNQSRQLFQRPVKSMNSAHVTVVIENAPWLDQFKADLSSWLLPVEVSFFDSVTEALLDLASNRPDMFVIEMTGPRKHQEMTLQALENFNKRGKSPLSVVLATEEKSLMSSQALGGSSIQLVAGPITSVWLHAYLIGVVASCKM
jgi:excisionase family DNA binding protein